MTGEVALWRAVIEQAVADASRRPRKEGVIEGLVKSISKDGRNARKRAKRAHEEALEWLKNDNRDFRIVCNLADLDPCATRQRALRLVNNPEPKHWRWRKRVFLKY